MKPEFRAFTKAMGALAVAIAVGMSVLVALTAGALYLLFPDGTPEQVDQAIRLAAGGVLLVWLWRMIVDERRHRRSRRDMETVTLKRQALLEDGWRYERRSNVWRHSAYPDQTFGLDAAFTQLKADNQAKLVLVKHEDPRE